MSIFGLRFYVVLALLGFGLVWASGIYLALIGYRGNPAECSSACFEGVIPSAVGYVLILVGGARALKRFIIGPGRVTVKDVESLQIGSGPEDENILAMANELLSQRKSGTRTHSVRTLAWSDRVPWYGPSFRRHGLRSPMRLVLPVSLRNKLDNGDWRNLLNFSFRQNRPPHVLHILAPFARTALLVILFIGTAATLSFSLGRYSSAVFGSVFGPVVLLFFLIHLGPTFRKTFLRTDSVIAASLGNRKLLDLFEKIDGLELPENENAKRRQGWAARLWPMPNISQRIANLKARSVDNSTGLEKQ